MISRQSLPKNEDENLNFRPASIKLASRILLLGGCEIPMTVPSTLRILKGTEYPSLP